MRKRVLLVSLMALLSGCAGIPNSGPVVQGQRVDVVRSDGYVRVIARPPAEGMAQDALVRGFLSACASVADGDVTARDYLTANASRSWSPQQLIQVYDASGLTVTADHGDAIAFKAPLLGTIDATHRYRAAAAGTFIDETFQLTQVRGQWRIGSTPKALYLGEADVARSYRVRELYFLNQDRSRLVPEYVVLPVGIGNLPTLLMRGLLSGPTTTDSASLATAVPQGAVMTSVSIDGVTASVQFSGGGLASNDVVRQALAAQVTWTLTQLPNVQTVRIYTDGSPMPLVSKRTLFSRSGLAMFDPAPQVANRSLSYVRGDLVYSLRDGEQKTWDPGFPASAVALAQDGLRATVSNTHKLITVQSGTDAIYPIFAGVDLAAPAALANHEVWFVDREAKGGLFVWTATRGVAAVSTGLRATARILDYAIAADGTRIALIVNDGATTTLRVGQIVRSVGETRVVGLSRIEQRLTSVVTVDWEGESSLLVLGAVGAVAVQPVRVTIPLGGLTLLGGPANAISLAAAPGAPIVVGDLAGQLWMYTDNRWSASELAAAPTHTL